MAGSEDCPGHNDQFPIINIQNAGLRLSVHPDRLAQHSGSLFQGICLLKQHFRIFLCIPTGQTVFFAIRSTKAILRFPGSIAGNIAGCIAGIFLLCGILQNRDALLTLFFEKFLQPDL